MINKPELAEGPNTKLQFKENETGFIRWKVTRRTVDHSLIPCWGIEEKRNKTAHLVT